MSSPEKQTPTLPASPSTPEVTVHEPLKPDETDTVVKDAFQPVPVKIKRKTRANWKVLYKNGDEESYPSVRVMAITFKRRGIECGKMEAFRAFVRRRLKKKVMKRASFEPFRDVESICQVKVPEYNLLKQECDE